MKKYFKVLYGDDGNETREEITRDEARDYLTRYYNDNEMLDDMLDTNDYIRTMFGAVVVERVPKYEIEIAVTVDKSPDAPLLIEYEGHDLVDLKDKVHFHIESICEMVGVTTGEVYVEISISCDGEYFDSEEYSYNLDTHSAVV